MKPFIWTDYRINKFRYAIQSWYDASYSGFGKDDDGSIIYVFWFQDSGEECPSFAWDETHKLLKDAEHDECIAMAVIDKPHWYSVK